MNLSNHQLLSLSSAIAALDGQTITQLVDGKPVPTQRIPRLTHSGRWILARNAGVLQRHIADFERARSALIKQHSAGTGAISPQSPNFNAFAEDLQKLNAETVDIALTQITPDDLRLEENEAANTPIPISVLNALSPLIL